MYHNLNREAYCFSYQQSLLPHRPVQCSGCQACRLTTHPFQILFEDIPPRRDKAKLTGRKQISKPHVTELMYCMFELHMRTRM